MLLITKLPLQGPVFSFLTMSLEEQFITIALWIYTCVGARLWVTVFCHGVSSLGIRDYFVPEQGLVIRSNG